MTVQVQAKQLWQAALSDLRQRLSRTAYENWFRPTEIVSIVDGVATIGAPNSFTISTLQSRYATDIERALAGVLEQPVQVAFTLLTPTGNSAEPAQRRDETAALIAGMQPPARVRRGRPARGSGSGTEDGQLRLNPDTGLIARYIFATYVAGASNRFAHAAALAVADAPGSHYNPLFVHGGVGLGKTHLLHAIGHRSLELHPGITVAYVSSEKFTNDLINAIRGQRMEDFRARYRTIDLLMIDDIQFIAGKDSTQEEFFHTFNTLYQNGKQVVLSSDRPPKEIAGLADRLRSRFEGGLIADVQPPDFEMRTAILRSRGDELGIILQNDVVEYIASKDQANIRELEGALTRVVAYARLSEQPITLALAMDALSGGGGTTRSVQVTTDEIIQAVARSFRVTESDLRGRGRSKDVVLPRQVAMYIMRTETGASLVDIGLAFGRDHTTVMHGVEKVEEQARTDPVLRGKLMAIKESLLTE